jgi:hypothetical protein
LEKQAFEAGALLPAALSEKIKRERAEALGGAGAAQGAMRALLDNIVTLEIATQPFIWTHKKKDRT